MNIIAIGINHKNTPIEVREELFLTPVQRDLLLSELKNNRAVLEACVLSTCNRIEIYVRVVHSHFDWKLLVQLIARIKEVPFSPPLTDHFYVHFNDKAIRHLLEVSAGLDSMVLGEEQILGQVKSAFERARAAGMLNRHFNILSNITVRVGKKARNETNISLGGSSVSWAAVKKAEEILGDLGHCSILVIGAGEMSELAVGHIQNRKFKKLFLMNRTQNNAKSLVEKYGGEAVSFCDIKEVLSQVDICICSAGAPHHILEKDTVARIMTLRNNRKLVFIDISMPRNIDPCVSEVDNVHLYSIDALKEVVGSNVKLREKAIDEVQEIIEDKFSEYHRKIQKMIELDQKALLDVLPEIHYSV